MVSSAKARMAAALNSAEIVPSTADLEADGQAAAEVVDNTRTAAPTITFQSGASVLTHLDLEADGQTAAEVVDNARTDAPTITYQSGASVLPHLDIVVYLHQPRACLKDHTRTKTSVS